MDNAARELRALRLEVAELKALITLQLGRDDTRRVTTESLSTAEAVAYCRDRGIGCSRRVLDRLRIAGRLTRVKLGRRNRWRLAELEQYCQGTPEIRG